MTIYRQAIDTFGQKAQMLMAVEECSELSTAIMHFLRNKATANDVCSEIADVQIMCEQLAVIFGEKAVQSERERKLERLQNILNSRTTNISADGDWSCA